MGVETLLMSRTLTLKDIYWVPDTFKDCDVCPEMVVISAGQFMMGAPSDEEGRYLAHSETLKHRPCRSHGVNVTMPLRPFHVAKPR